MQLVGQVNNPSVILPEKKPSYHVQEARWAHGPNTELRRRENNFSPNDIHTPDGLTCRIDWGIKEDFRIGEWKQTACIRALQLHQLTKNARTKNTLTGHLRNYEQISAIPTHRTEIQTAKSMKFVNVCLTVVSFAPTAFIRKYPRNREPSQET